jgi:hypothetical protein
MSKDPALSCPGCGSIPAETSLLLLNRPVIQNYRFTTPSDARHVTRRDIDLRQCAECGLVFNAAFDLNVVPYDEHYENSQNFSPSFQALMEGTADHLAKNYDLRKGQILEVGCGKGAFLNLLCERHGLEGMGFDTSCATDTSATRDRVKFHRRYVTAEDITFPVSAVICRHVVEHVPAIGDFLAQLYQIARAADSQVVYLETPAWEWIVEHQAFWDVFYEHCNYFSMPTLRHLAERAGFRVLDHRLIFDGQYQALELALSGQEPIPAPGILEESSLLRFAENFKEGCHKMQKGLLQAGAGEGWAIWGAGARGVSLAAMLEELQPAFVVDSNPAKQGCFLPGTGLPVLSPADERLSEVSVVLISNPVYEAEIREQIGSRACRPFIASS